MNSSFCCLIFRAMPPSPSPGGSSPRVSTPFEFAPAAKIGVSIGHRRREPRDGNTADELLSAADRAMYEAKTPRQGRVCDFVRLMWRGLAWCRRWDADAGFAEPALPHLADSEAALAQKRLLRRTKRRTPRSSDQRFVANLKGRRLLCGLSLVFS